MAQGVSWWLVMGGVGGKQNVAEVTQFSQPKYLTHLK